MSDDHFDPATYREWVRGEIPQYDQLQESIAAATAAVEAKAILDLGTGTGETLARVLPLHPAARVIGVDESKGMLAVARDALADYDVTLLVAGLLDTLPSGPFDLVVSALAVHHLDGPVMRRSSGRHSVSSALTGLPVVELTTVGARSGERRTLPLIGVPDGDRLVLVASNYGQQHNPAWYYNLKANPRCSTAFRGQRHEMEAYEADGEERQRLWELDVSVYPPRNHYALRAGNRCIPVMVLQPTPRTG